MAIDINYSFEDYISCIKKCYAKDVHDQIPEANDFPGNIVKSYYQRNFKEVVNFGINHNNVFMTSLCNRIVGVYKIQLARRNNSKIKIIKTQPYLHLNLHPKTQNPHN